MNIDGVVSRDLDTLNCTVFLNASIEPSKRMARILKPRSRLRRRVGAPMEVEVDEFTDVGFDCLGGETKLTVLSDLDVDVGKSNTDERKEQ